MRLPLHETKYKGYPLFDLDSTPGTNTGDLQISVAYDPITLEGQYYFINRILVEQDDLVVLLADTYETDNFLENQIRDYLHDESCREWDRRIVHETAGMIRRAS